MAASGTATPERTPRAGPTDEQLQEAMWRSCQRLAIEVRGGRVRGCRYWSEAIHFCFWGLELTLPLSLFVFVFDLQTFSTIHHKF